MRKLIRRPGILKEIIEEPLQKKKILKIRRKRCSYFIDEGIKCNNFCAGKGNFCAKHSRDIFKESAFNAPVLPSINSVSVIYDPINHPTEFIRLANEGMNPTEIAAEFKVSMQTIAEWKETHTLFNQAFDIGKAAHEAWYLKMGKTNLDNRFFQTPLFKLLTMNNGMGWSDKIETKGNIQGQFGVLLVPGQMTMDEWEQNNIDENSQKTIEHQ